MSPQPHAGDSVPWAASSEVRRAKREQLAQDAGFDDWAAAINATRHLSHNGAARKLHTGVDTIRVWRRQLPH